MSAGVALEVIPSFHVMKRKREPKGSSAQNEVISYSTFIHLDMQSLML